MQDATYFLNGSLANQLQLTNFCVYLWTVEPWGAVLHGHDFKVSRGTAYIGRHWLVVSMIHGVQIEVDQGVADEQSSETYHQH